MNPEYQFFLPAARSDYAARVDTLFVFLNWLSLVLFLLITGAAAYWVWKHHRKAGDENKLSTPTFHSTAIELFWSVGPMIVSIGLFHWGVTQYLDARIAPAGAMEVRVHGQKWAWEFEYANGKVTSDLHVPVNKPVRLIMTSKDVIHSFYVPDFRIKQDVVPGRYSTVWFEANQEGTDQVFCAEYCGLSHSGMLSHVIVESQDKFQTWLDADEDKGLPAAEIGKKLYETKSCNTCHTLDGTIKVGPSWKGVYGREETMTDGKVVKVDDAYIRESILQPQAKVVKGFQPVMPSFQGSLKDKQIEGIIEYMKTLK